MAGKAALWMVKSKGKITGGLGDEPRRAAFRRGAAERSRAGRVVATHAHCCVMETVRTDRGGREALKHTQSREAAVHISVPSARGGPSVTRGTQG